jgi:hypothetical protein
MGNGRWPGSYFISHAHFPFRDIQGCVFQPTSKNMMGGAASLLAPRPLAAAAKPWLHGKGDRFVHIHAVQARLVSVAVSAVVVKAM